MNKTNNDKIPIRQKPTPKVIKRLRGLLGERAVVFVGLMGAGKSTIGKCIASILDLPFYDSDQQIEAVSKMTIAELFATYGEAEFRDLERRVIRRLLKQGAIVLSTGGGAYMNVETRCAIKQNAVSIWLNAELDVLLERASRRKNRPLLQRDDPRSMMKKLMEERYPVYAEADIRVLSQDTQRDIVAHDVIKCMDAYLSNKNF